MGERSCFPCDEPVLDPRPPSCPLQCGSPKCKGYHKIIIDKSVKPVVWLLGGPGSGKRTQSKKISERYGFVRITIGSLVREDADKRHSNKTNLIKEIMSQGGLLPNDLVLAMLKEKVLSIRDEAPGLLIDGYPREPAQGLEFIRNISPPSVIIYLELGEADLLERLKHRAPNPDSSMRIDTSESVFQEKINIFFEHNDQILTLHNDLIRKVNGAGTPDQVFNEIARILDPIMTDAEIEIENRRICKKKELVE